MLREVDKPQGSRDLTTVDQEILRAAIDPEGQFWIGVGLPVVLGAAILEGLVLTLRRRYDWRAFLSTWGDVAGRQAIGVLGYYWYHRAAHRVRRFWATHSVHHSPNEPTLAASLRMGWTGKLTGTALFFVPLMWLGFSPVAVTATLSLTLLYQFWVHATWIPKLGPLEWVLNTPSHHRVHHGRDPEYLDCNRSAVLIVFDRMLGTFVEERDDITIRYGLAKPVTTCNPTRIALQEWQAMARDLRAAPSWRQRLVAVVGLPPTAQGVADRPATAGTPRARLNPSPPPRRRP